jgi:hypothetical protein
VDILCVYKVGFWSPLYTLTMGDKAVFCLFMAISRFSPFFSSSKSHDGRLYGISPDEAEEDRLLEQRRVDLVRGPRWAGTNPNLVNNGDDLHNLYRDNEALAYCLIAIAIVRDFF